MAHAPDIAALTRALRNLPDFAAIAPSDLAPLDGKGLAHAHWRVQGRGVVLRVPRMSQTGLDPHANLAHQAACFARAQPSGHTPRLRAVVEPGPELPFGMLIVEAIIGHPPRLPGDLPALADALAAIHRLLLPRPAARAPLADPADSFAATLQAIDANLPFAENAGLDPGSTEQIATERAWLARFHVEHAPRLPPPPRCLVMTDTHPGNFIVDVGGQAVFVDLEKSVYGHPAVDLAHATIPPAVDWDPDCAAALDPATIAAFYGRYIASIPADVAGALRPWLLPCRRLTWLRTTSFFLRWRAMRPGAAGLDARMRAHVEGCIAEHLTSATMRRTRGEWLDGRWIDP